MKDFPDPLVVMALPAESDGVFEAAEIPVLYCGVGKVNAAIALLRELCRYRQAERDMPRVLNFGTAGSRRHDTGAYIACREFVQRDMDVSGLGFALGETPFDAVPARLTFPLVVETLPAGVCGSGDSFATADCDLECAVLDMEAYALAKVCWVEKAAFACVKYVTDGADHAAPLDWHSNVHKAAVKFLAIYRLLKDDAHAWGCDDESR